MRANLAERDRRQYARYAAIATRKRVSLKIPQKLRTDS